MTFFLVIILLPAACLGIATRILAIALRAGARNLALKLLSAAALLAAPVLWLDWIISQNSWGAAISSVYLFVVLALSALGAGVVLLMKPPKLRRVTGAVLLIGYPALLLATASVVVAAHHGTLIKIETSSSGR